MLKLTGNTLFSMVLGLVFNYIALIQDYYCTVSTAGLQVYLRSVWLNSCKGCVFVCKSTNTSLIDMIFSQ